MSRSAGILHRGQIDEANDGPARRVKAGQTPRAPRLTDTAPLLARRADSERRIGVADAAGGIPGARPRRRLLQKARGQTPQWETLNSLSAGSLSGRLWFCRTTNSSARSRTRREMPAQSKSSARWASNKYSRIYPYKVAKIATTRIVVKEISAVANPFLSGAAGRSTSATGRGAWLKAGLVVSLSPASPESARPRRADAPPRRSAGRSPANSRRRRWPPAR